jgi:hypothetical protein
VYSLRNLSLIIIVLEIESATILRSFLYITTLLSSLYLFAIIRLANLLEVEIIIVVSSTFRSLIAL